MRVLIPAFQILIKLLMLTYALSVAENDIPGLSELPLFVQVLPLIFAAGVYGILDVIDSENKEN